MILYQHYQIEYKYYESIKLKNENMEENITYSKKS